MKIRFVFLSYLRALSSSPVYDVPAIEDNIEIRLIRVLHMKIVYCHFVKKLFLFKRYLHGFPGLLNINNLFLDDGVFSIEACNKEGVSFQSVDAVVCIILNGFLPVRFTCGA